MTRSTNSAMDSGSPPGKYTIEVWHEKFLPVTQEVELKSRKTATLNFELTTPR